MMNERDELIYDPSQIESTSGFVLATVAILFLLLGLGGGLYYAWELSPVIEEDTRPDQLKEEYKLDYISAIALDYARFRNRQRTSNLLSQLDPVVDPFQLAADAACEIQRPERGLTSSDVEVIRLLIDYFKIQSVSVSCALQDFATSAPSILPTATATISWTLTPAPVSTKTPTPSALPIPSLTAVPDNDNAFEFDGQFSILRPNSFCSPNNSGVIEIRVERANFDTGIAGVPIEVRWNTTNGQEQQRFFTGLKPNIDPGFADFQMQEGIIYQVRIPGQSELSQRLEATTCPDGYLISYQVTFRSP